MDTLSSIIGMICGLVMWVIAGLVHQTRMPVWYLALLVGIMVMDCNISGHLMA